MKKSKLVALSAVFLLAISCVQEQKKQDIKYNPKTMETKKDNNGNELSLMENFTVWIEPMYKAIWSNKMFMVILSELFPDSEYILKCSENPDIGNSFVKKPLLSREGSNVTIMNKGVIII